MKAIRRGLRVVAGCAMLTIAGANAGCGSSPSSTGAGGELAIGLITSTSGIAGQLSGIATRGANVAIHDINAGGGVRGGRRLRLEVCDNGSATGLSDPEKTVACASRFLREHLSAVAIADEGSLAVVKNQLTANRVITVGAFGSPDFDNPRQLPYVFSLVSSDDKFLSVTVGYIRSKGYRRVAELSDTSAPSTAISRAFEDRLRAAGIPVVASETVGLADVDVSAQTSRVVASHPDLVFINTYGLAAAHAARDLIDAHGSFAMLGSGSFSTTPVPIILGVNDIRNLRLTTFTSATARARQPYSPRLQHLVDGIHADGGGPLASGGTIFLAEYGYDMVSVLAHGYNAASSSDPDAVRAALEGLHLTRAAGDVYIQDVTYPPGHHAPVCDPGSTNFSYGRVPDSNGVLTEADPPLPSCS